MVTVNRRSDPLHALLKLSHDLASPMRPLAILAEGNVSARLSDTTFLVKASGSSLGTLRKEDVVECRNGPLLELLRRRRASDAEVTEAMTESRLVPTAKRPSVEALFHAWLLTLAGVEFAAHTHAPAVTSVLCSPRAREFAAKRVLPDEIVCCDVESVFVPYTDPGLQLAQVVRRKTEAFIGKHGRPPRVVLLENHGLITLGRTSDGVLAAMLMAEKVAGIWLGAVALGGPVFLTPKHVDRIASRPDEAIRRKILSV
jgi:rhamnose utilization protein RhaD (predicted bifunctional aldolase and dehydrogenase)